MAEKNYYAARKGILKPVPMDFPMLKKVFLYVFNEFKNNLLLREATGYNCVDSGETPGLWGTDINAYIFLKLKMDNIWPIPEYIETYDEPTLFTVIEFLRKEDCKLPSKDDDDLFKIMNGFDIRHHNKYQQSGYDRDVWYDWMFYTFLASINILLKLRDDKRKSVAVKEKAPFIVEHFK